MLLGDNRLGLLLLWLFNSCFLKFFLLFFNFRILYFLKCNVKNRWFTNFSVTNLCFFLIHFILYLFLLKHLLSLLYFFNLFFVLFILFWFNYQCFNYLLFLFKFVHISWLNYCFIIEKGRWALFILQQFANRNFLNTHIFLLYWLLNLLLGSQRQFDLFLVSCESASIWTLRWVTSNSFTHSFKQRALKVLAHHIHLVVLEVLTIWSLCV